MSDVYDEIRRMRAETDPDFANVAELGDVLDLVHGAVSLAEAYLDIDMDDSDAYDAIRDSLVRIAALAAAGVEAFDKMKAEGRLVYEDDE